MPTFPPDAAGTEGGESSRLGGRDSPRNSGPTQNGSDNGDAAEPSHILRERLLASVSESQAAQISRQELRHQLARTAERLARQLGEAHTQLDLNALVDSVVDDLVGLGPLEKLLRDFEVSDILINGPRQIY